MKCKDCVFFEWSIVYEINTGTAHVQLFHRHLLKKPLVSIKHFKHQV